MKERWDRGAVIKPNQKAVEHAVDVEVISECFPHFNANENDLQDGIPISFRNSFQVFS